MSNGEETVIHVNNLYKDFVLPHQKTESVKNIFTSIFSSSDRSYEMQHALADISFEIKKGEFFGIVGRNGSGKSTLLKVLAGIYQPTKGVVKTKGRIVPFIELGVGFNGELTGRENVFLNGALLGFSDDEIAEKYQEIVDFAEIERFMDQKLKNYSSGMQVRLAFSVATKLAESDILLIDEVLAVGDADFQRKCFDYFRKLKKEKKTVVFVSHDMNAIREYCDKAVLINDSRIVAKGSASKVAQEYFQIFNKDTASDSIEEEDSRWGSGEVKFKRLRITPKKLQEDDDIFTISMVIEAVKDADNVVPGFSIKSQSGQQLFGSNTYLEGEKPYTFKAGEKKEIIWSVPNIFNTGTYLLDLAMIKWQTPEVYDWWNDALSIDALIDNSTLYAVKPKVTVSIKEA